MGGLILSHCVQNLCVAGTGESSCELKHIKVNPVPGSEREMLLLSVSGRYLRTVNAELVFGVGQVRGLGGELLVLLFGGQGLVGLGVVDDLGEQA